MRTMLNLLLLLLCLSAGILVAVARPDTRLGGIVAERIVELWPASASSVKWAMQNLPLAALCVVSAMAIAMAIRPAKRRPDLRAATVKGRARSSDISSQADRSARVTELVPQIDASSRSNPPVVSEPASQVQGASSAASAIGCLIVIGALALAVYFGVMRSTNRREAAAYRGEAAAYARAASVVSQFMQQFERDFCKYESETPAALSRAQIPWSIEQNQRNGQFGYVVRMEDALRWGEKWISASDYALLVGVVDSRKKIWMSNFNLEVF